MVIFTMAERNPNSLANLKPAWSKENQPENRGAKPSNMKKYIRDNNLSHQDIKHIAKYVLPLTEKQIKALINDEKKPIAVRIFARAIVKDLASGKMTNTMQLLDRAYGKPQETVEVKDNKPQVHILLPDNMREMQEAEAGEDVE